jgi:hypothetical protein
MKPLYGFCLVVSLLMAGIILIDNSARAELFYVLQSGAEGLGQRKPDQPESYDINYSYDPAGRRDPFISLLGGIKAKAPVTPKGALSVTDARVVGITRGKDGYVAIIMGSDKKARFMKTGDKLYDGEIISIEAEKVVFRQDLTEDNPTAPGLKSKEVTKRLHPVQEGT